MKSSPIFCTLYCSLVRLVAVTANSVDQVCYSAVYNNSIVDYIGNFLRSIASLPSADRYWRETVKYDLLGISNYQMNYI